MTVEVSRKGDSHILAAVYTVWNAVASGEGFPRVRPDESDEYASTTHVLARDCSTGLPIGAGRLLLVDHGNVRLDRVCVLPSWRQRGVGRALVKRLLDAAHQEGQAHGTVHVHATKGSETGFFSILGFEPVGNERMDEALGNVSVRTMLLNAPVCTPPPSGGCVGLHHASIRVSDIEQSLAFYGCVGFTVSDKFVTSAGARACFVEGLGTRLELVECPVAGNAGQLAGVVVPSAIGFDRLVFDVTKACTDLDIYLQHLQRRNGGLLEVAAQPSKEVVGNIVMAVASIYDPDGLPIEFIRREAQIPGELITKVKW